MEVARQASSRRFILLDRDGTIVVERNYLSRPDQLEFLPSAAAGMRLLSQIGFGLVVVTNQSGIGRGYFTTADLEGIHSRLLEMLVAEGVYLDGIYHCPHIPESGCACRKPRPGLAYAAARDLGFEPSSAIVIGDKACDIDLGRSIGAKTLLVRTGYGAELLSTTEIQPDFAADNLLEAATIIRTHCSNSPIQDARGQFS